VRLGDGQSCDIRCAIPATLKKEKGKGGICHEHIFLPLIFISFLFIFIFIISLFFSFYFLFIFSVVYKDELSRAVDSPGTHPTSLLD